MSTVTTGPLDPYSDFAVRQTEGWDLFECDGIEHAPYELEKDDEADKFEGDIDVWRHVLSQACAGSGAHLRALGFLALYSPEELVGIWHCLFYGEYRTYLRKDYPWRVTVLTGSVHVGHGTRTPGSGAEPANASVESFTPAPIPARVESGTTTPGGSDSRK